LFFKREDELVGKIDQVAEQIFLDEVLRHKAGRLSHGQKQWLEIGMLLMQDPELLLLDEPVAGMSAREREQTAELLNRISEGPLDRGDRARYGIRPNDCSQGNGIAPRQTAG
jgi:urea transport system ATP-binding protein